jgi:hypothetical protein
MIRALRFGTLRLWSGWGTSRRPPSRTSRPAMIHDSGNWTRVSQNRIVTISGRYGDYGTPRKGRAAPFLERVTRIELALSAWEADVLPLNYTRERPPDYLATPGPREHTPPLAWLTVLARAQVTSSGGRRPRRWSVPGSRPSSAGDGAASSCRGSTAPRPHGGSRTGRSSSGVGHPEGDPCRRRGDDRRGRRRTDAHRRVRGQCQPVDRDHRAARGVDDVRAQRRDPEDADAGIGPRRP